MIGCTVCHRPTLNLLCWRCDAAAQHALPGPSADDHNIPVAPGRTRRLPAPRPLWQRDLIAVAGWLGGAFLRRCWAALRGFFRRKRR